MSDAIKGSSTSIAMAIGYVLGRTSTSHTSPWIVAGLAVATCIAFIYAFGARSRDRGTP